MDLEVKRMHVCVLVVGVVEPLVPEERDEAPVTKTRYARVLRLADGDAHVIRQAGALLGGIHRCSLVIGMGMELWTALGLNTQAEREDWGENTSYISRAAG
jgi:hypothetical protein